MNNVKKINKRFVLVTLFSLLMLLVAACGPATTIEPEAGQSEEHGDSHSDGDSHGDDGHHDEGDSHSEDDGHHGEGDGHSDDDGHHNEGDGHDHGSDMVPNDGAVIAIVAPEDGSVFANGEEILVEVEVTDFALGEDGNHWHVYVDEASYGMVMGNNMDEVLRGLDAGTYEVMVRLANGDHIDLMDGDSVTITIE